MTTPTLAALLGRGLYEALTLVAPYPAVALPLARVWGYGVPAGPGTEIVIDGFPRSGTAFAVAAFRRAQGRPVRIAHHLHAPANLIAGGRRGIPALLVIRDPAEAVVEWCVSKPRLTVGQSLRGYVRFHAPLLAHRNRLEVGTHEEVMAGLGAVVRRLNSRFGTHFAEPASGEAERAAIGQQATGDYEARRGAGPRVLGRAAGDDGSLREGLRAEYDSPRHAVLRERAERLYAGLTRRA